MFLYEINGKLGHVLEQWVSIVASKQTTHYHNFQEKQKWKINQN